MTAIDSSQQHAYDKVDTVHMTLEEVRALSTRVLEHYGFTRPHVEAVTETLVAGERDGCSSHGLYRLLSCINTLKAGKVAPDATPELHDIAPALLRIDAKGGFSQVAYLTALPHLIDKAKALGIAALGINHCAHFSALWADIEPLTDAGLVAFACTPSHAWVMPAGGSKPLFGTNPLAFGWPRPDKPAFIFDFATSMVARGEIELHRRAGKPIPEGWGVDAEGNPCTDPATVLDHGAMLTFGGHKGSALAAMVELIAGPLIADMTSAESLAFDAGAKVTSMGGELIIAIDPHRFLGAQAETELARAETLFESMVAQGARLPSQRRYLAREKSIREGVWISKTLYNDICNLIR
ncbi:LDH2 family malate/lactate/ureidoglycolate dehydrogenase [Pseudomonas duriflava]|uniref:LDH2 family malate/lactate/ureidoglycolate dehydrogenase n=1 Tax=Pseudomonas duriflava TaxID=459528 RepID=A0A562Q7H5_9PSED|nr:Ldh family oxidoreductase [Pseudomonas duriflava]TWI52697.1 LDH2 family malate/lactate/ureidoglycolate dehydrogenase [Pseudomonas duriflava]